MGLLKRLHIIIQKYYLEMSEKVITSYNAGLCTAYEIRYMRFSEYVVNHYSLLL